jgi:hypothetical protein
MVTAVAAAAADPPRVLHYLVLALFSRRISTAIESDANDSSQK